MWLAAPVLCLVSLTAYAEEALVDGFHLKPASAVVKVGGTVKLSLDYCEVVDKNPANKPKAKPDSKPSGKQADDELAPLRMKYPGEDIPDDELAPLPVLKLVCEGDDGYDVLPPLVLTHMKWEVIDGPGRVSGDNKGATYHAPASKPTPNQATVAVTFKYPLNIGVGGKSYPKAKQTLLSRITILDEVKTYTGTFSLYEVTVNSEYTSNLAGNMTWKFEEYYDIGGWREYTGSGNATFHVSRKGCGTHAEFSNVPVEGRLKVYDDKKYEFLINLVGDAEQTRTCRHGDAKWVETFSPGGYAMNSADPCGLKEFYPPYSNEMYLSMDRQGGCADNVRNQYREAWSFKAVK
jgi:hypothetical protein